jgi:hypothetical protein
MYMMIVMDDSEDDLIDECASVCVLHVVSCQSKFPITHVLMQLERNES